MYFNTKNYLKNNHYHQGAIKSTSLLVFENHHFSLSLSLSLSLSIYIYILAVIPARCRGLFFCIKNIKKNNNLKILGFSVKLYLRILGLAATSDLRVIFIILIIKLNLHDPSLSEFGCNTGPKNTGCGSDYKVVS